MVLELHVWGPAFGLPSIDAECNAAIAYLNRAVSPGQWIVVADHDTAISPNNEFPALRDGSSYIAGFQNIVQYLQQYPAGPYSLDSGLTSQQTADKAAFSAFLETTARPLLDLSLYTSFENYSNITAPAYTAILPWHTNYIAPPTHRDAARARTAHLGLGGLDVDTSGLESPETGAASLSGEFEAAKKAAGIPSDSRASRPGLLSLGRQKGIQGLLSSPVYAARFRLDALANDFLGPLFDLLGKKNYLLSDSQPSSLDCLAFGYLALMLYPAVPQAWLKEAIQARYPKVVKYIWRMREELLGGGEEIKAADVFSLTAYRGRSDIELEDARRKIGLRLPWHPTPSEPPSTMVLNIAREIASSIPILSLAFRRSTIQPSSSPSPSTISPNQTSSLPSPLLLNSLAAFSTAVISAIAGIAIHQSRYPRSGDLFFEAPREQWQGLGQAGDLLGALAEHVRAEKEWSTRWQSERSGGDGGMGADQGMATVAEVGVEGGRER